MFKYVRNHKKTTTAFLLIVILVIVPYLTSRIRSVSRRVRVFQSADESSALEPRTIRIGTYNIAHGRGLDRGNWDSSPETKRRRLGRIAQLVNEHKLDVLVLNEVDFCSTWTGHFNQAEIIANVAKFPNRVEQRNLDFRFAYGSFKFGNAVLSKFPIREAELIRLPPHSRWEDWLAGSKCSTLITLDLGDGIEIKVCPIHLEHRSEETRISSAQKWIDLAESKTPTVFAGDFNSSPTCFAAGATDANGINLMDKLFESSSLEFRLNDPLPTNEMTFSADRPRKAIDWILLSGGLKFVPGTYEVVDSLMSDHRMVVAEIIVPESRKWPREKESDAKERH